MKTVCESVIVTPVEGWCTWCSLEDCSHHESFSEEVYELIESSTLQRPFNGLGMRHHNSWHENCVYNNVKYMVK